MPTVTIDPARCKKDGICVSVCPAKIFVQPAQLAAIELEDEQYCITCGQCVAVCPQGAISHSGFAPNQIAKIDFGRMPTAEQVLELLKSRRSIRAFRDKPLAAEVINQIIDGARFAPSGHNSQSTEFAVVQDRGHLKEISAIVVEYLKFEVKRFANPLFRTMARLADRGLAEAGLREIPGFKRTIQVFEAGVDPVLHGAPALLVFHARRTDGFADVNTHLALQNASLVAHALGIGHFYTGWVVSPCRAPMAKAWNRRIPDLIGVPPQNKMHGALALGYPIPQFKNRVEKRPAPTRWI